MNKLASTTSDDSQRWKLLVEAAIFEKNARNLQQRIQEAQDAIMDRIEDSFQSASQSERQSLINAMNSLRELRRMVQTPPSQFDRDIRTVDDA